MSLNSFPDIGAIFDRFDTSAAEEFIANYFSRVFFININEFDQHLSKYSTLFNCGSGAPLILGKKIQVLWAYLMAVRLTKIGWYF